MVEAEITYTPHDQAAYRRNNMKFFVILYFQNIHTMNKKIIGPLILTLGLLLTACGGRESNPNAFMMSVDSIQDTVAVEDTVDSLLLQAQLDSIEALVRDSIEAARLDSLEKAGVLAQLAYERYNPIITQFESLTEKCINMVETWRKSPENHKNPKKDPVYETMYLQAAGLRAELDTLKNLSDEQRERFRQIDARFKTLKH